jgi:hypothetical protein
VPVATALTGLIADDRRASFTSLGPSGAGVALRAWRWAGVYFNGHGSAEVSDGAAP